MYSQCQIMKQRASDNDQKRTEEKSESNRVRQLHLARKQQTLDYREVSGGGTDIFTSQIKVNNFPPTRQEKIPVQAIFQCKDYVIWMKATIPCGDTPENRHLLFK